MLTTHHSPSSTTIFLPLLYLYTFKAWMGKFHYLSIFQVIGGEGRDRPYPATVLYCLSVLFRKENYMFPNFKRVKTTTM
jgi:hypothetical protein